jgi:hypothetical protein
MVMAAGALRRPGSDGPRGAKNKVYPAINSMRNEALSLRTRYKILPLDFMPGILNDVTEPKERRIQMAIAAAPFLHFELGVVEVTGGDSSPPVSRVLDCSKLSDGELQLLEELLRKAQPTPPVPDAVEPEVINSP